MCSAVLIGVVLRMLTYVFTACTRRCHSSHCVVLFRDPYTTVDVVALRAQQQSMIMGAAAAIAVLVVGIPAAIILGSQASREPKEITFQEFKERILKTQRVRNVRGCA